MKHIVILGSTGSIGVNALDVIEKLGADYAVLALTAYGNAELFMEQVKKFRPRFACVMNEEAHKKIKDALPEHTKLLPAEMESLTFLASLPSADLIINGLVGSVGFLPLLSAVKHGKTIALANKEPIVMAGRSIMEECHRWDAKILPVDSEPSAIFQCLERKGTLSSYEEGGKSISRVLLTASGGPFFKRKGSLKNVTPAEAVAHPRWKMGKKISVDSATLMNKGFEAIEIMHLFNLPLEKIDIVVHPQSIVHSAVEYADGSIIAQMSNPDMRLPIQYAVTYPQRVPSPVRKLSLKDIAKLEFAEPDFKKFPCLELALWCAQKGASYPAALSGADETAVDAFLKGEILFTDIPKLVYTVLKAHRCKPGKVSLIEAAETESWARTKAAEYVKNKKYTKAVL